MSDEPTHIKLTLVKEQSANWKRVLAEDATGKLIVDDANKDSKKRA